MSYKYYVFLLALLLLAPSAADARSLQRPPNNLGLVGYWSFNEGTGAVVTDFSGRGNHGSRTGTTTWVPGKLGFALSLNGSTGYVTVPDTNALSFGNGTTDTTFTMSAWVKMVDATRFRIFNKADTLNQAEYQFTVDANDKLRMSLFDANVNNRVETISDQTLTAYQGAWVHVVATSTGGGLTGTKLYINGALVSSTNSSALSYSAMENGTFPLYIGRYDVNYANGVIDEARMYNRVLSASDIAKLYTAGTTKFNSQIQQQGTNLSNGLVGHWTFDGKYLSSTIATDTSGQGNNGTLTGGPRPAFGRLGQALQFDGTDDYVDAGSGISTSNITAMTQSVWIKNAAAAANKAVLGWYVTDGLFLQTLTSANDGLLALAGGGSAHGSLAIQTVGKWVHVVLVYDGSQSSDATRLKMFVDGVQQTLSFGGAIPASITTSGSLKIGDVGALDRKWNGSIDDVRIYNRALTAGEVKQLYGVGATKFNSQTEKSGTSLASGLVGHWTFDGKYLSTTTATDASGQGNNGTLTGGPRPTFGRLGQALQVDGVDDYVDFGVSSGSLLVNTNFSVAFWTKVTGSCVGFCGFIAKSQSGPYPFAIRSLPTMQYMINSDVLDTSFSPVVGTWYHVLATFDTTSGRKFYVDGVLRASDAYTTVPGNNGDSVYMGLDYIPSGNRFVPALFDDVRIYNRALTAGEVKQLYDLGR